MENDSLDKLGPLMNELGQMLVEIADGDPDGIFLYVEIAEGWVRASVFKDGGKAVRYLDADALDASNLLFDIWHSVPKEKRWTVMEYDINDGSFEVSFKYSEEVGVEVYDRGRRQAALRARYGDKPVVYPPPDGAVEWKP
ncbi:MAG: hypothetical protein EOP62_03740 [Sphingomonadales bacterium]|nr:MAG: hypothetical protein EOP62_03740 [Sphingomonadales bacterium]